MVAKTGGEKAGTGEARGWGREQTNRAKTKAHPMTSMDRIIIEGRGGRSHVKHQPRIAAPTERESQEVSATVEINREGHKEGEQDGWKREASSSTRRNTESSHAS
jgi:hypothetical protein